MSEQTHSWDIFHAMEHESDLGFIVTAEVFVDYGLQRVLGGVFTHIEKLELFKEFRSAGSFSIRLDLCLALDLIGDPLWEDLRVLHRLRNEAAHLKRGPRFSLGDQSFTDMIWNLHEIRDLRGDPRLVQEERDKAERTGVLYEGPRSQLYWAVTGWLGKLDKIAPEFP